MVLLLVTVAATGTVMGTQYVSAHGHCHGHHGHYKHHGGYVPMSGGGGGGGGY